MRKLGSTTDSHHFGHHTRRRLTSPRVYRDVAYCSRLVVVASRSTVPSLEAMYAHFRYLDANACACNADKTLVFWKGPQGPS